MANYNEMRYTTARFSRFLQTNPGPDSRIANLIETNGKRSPWGKVKKYVRIKATNKTIQKTAAATVVVAGIVAAPFTGGLTAVPSIAVAIAFWAGDVAIQKGLDKIIGKKSADELKEDYKRSVRHLKSASEHRKALSKQPDETVIQDENGQEVFRYDPRVGIHLFRYAHHVHKAEKTIAEMKDIVTKLENELANVTQNDDQFIKNNWDYTRDKFKVAMQYFRDPFNPETVDSSLVARNNNHTTAHKPLPSIPGKPLPAIPGQRAQAVKPLPQVPGGIQKPLPPIPGVRN